MESNTELYLYLFCKNKIHFFIHFIKKNEFVNKISYNLYDVLMDIDIIIDYSESIVIYEFNKDICNIISIQHVNSEYNNEYNKEDLQIYFKELIVWVKRNNLCVIEYDYDNNKYNKYSLDDQCILKKIKEIPTNIIINNIINIDTQSIIQC